MNQNIDLEDIGDIEGLCSECGAETNPPEDDDDCEQCPVCGTCKVQR